jgi:hypothetical protein
MGVRLVIVQGTTARTILTVMGLLRMIRIPQYRIVQVPSIIVQQIMVILLCLHIVHRVMHIVVVLVQVWQLLPRKSSRRRMIHDVPLVPVLLLYA